MLGDGAVVQAGARGHEDGLGKAGAEDVVGARGERLDPAELGEALGGVAEVVGGVGPGHEDLGVGQLVGDGGFHVVGVQGGAEALEALDVELEGCGVEELHDVMCNLR